MRWGVIGLAVVFSLPHPVSLIVRQFSAASWSIDGMAWMTDGDRAIIQALRTEPPGTTMIEAVGGAYSEYARLSSASGVPTYLGWANHEGVWRGGAIHEETERRRELVSNLYSARDPATVRRLAQRAGVDLVAIGSLEHKDYSAAMLSAVAAAGEVVLDRDGGMLVRFRFPDASASP
jgi:uncharacterized membrane protein